MLDMGVKILIITNDVVTTEDAKRVQRTLEGVLVEERILGRNRHLPAHGGARRPEHESSDPRRHGSAFPDTDVVLIESGGGNSTLTFCAAPVEFFIYVIDVAAGDKVLRKNGPAITQSHILIMNKIDLAPYVGASLDVMARDSKPMRATNRSCSPTAAPARVSPSRFKSSVGICCSTCD